MLKTGMPCRGYRDERPLDVADHPHVVLSLAAQRHGRRWRSAAAAAATQRNTARASAGKAQQHLQPRRLALELPDSLRRARSVVRQQ
jgi:hypothetical protein